MKEGQPAIEQIQEHRLATSQGLIDAAKNAVLNGEPVDIDGLNPSVHGAETVGYINMLRRRGIAALDGHQITL